MLAVVVLLALGGAGYLLTAFPKVSPAGNEKVDVTPERLARGEYLTHHVSECWSCHSTRDWSLFTAPVEPDSLGKGGEVFTHSMGFPGTLVAPNITPAHLKDWTDGEIIRALRVGVSKDGRALFPLMPYQHLAGASKEDLYSIVAYLRNLKPLANDPPQTKLDFPMNLIVRAIPKDAPPYPAEPDKAKPKAYRKYVMNLAMCMDCHTPRDAHGKPKPGMDFAGGFTVTWPDGTKTTTANITPDPGTGIGNWSKDDFIKYFRLMGEYATTQKTQVQKGDFQTFMPWEQYSGMTDGDLGAIYDYLILDVKPVRNAVQKSGYAPRKG